MTRFILIYLFFISDCVFAQEINLSVNPKFLVKLDHDIEKLSGRKFRYSDELVNYRGVLSKGEERFEVKFDIHGDLDSHWRESRKSYKVKLRHGQSMWGMRHFSLIRAEDKNEELEVWAQQASEKLGLVARKIFAIDLKLNGVKQGRYIVYEKIFPDAFEHNGIPDAFLISQNNVWKTSINTKDSLIPNAFMNRNLRDTSISLSPTFYKIRPKHNSSQVKMRWERTLKNIEHFDYEAMAKYLTLVALTGSYHSALPDNLRWIYRPWSGRFEPIYYDTIPNKAQNNPLFFIEEVKRLNFLLSKIIDSKPLSFWITNIQKYSDNLSDKMEFIDSKQYLQKNHSIIQKWSL